MIVINGQTWWHQALIIFEKILKNQFLFCILIKLFFVFSKNDVFLQIFHFLRWNFVLGQSWEFGSKLRTEYFQIIVINRQTWWHQALIIFEKILKNQFLFCILIKLFCFLSKNDVFLQIFHFLRWNFVLEQSWEFGSKLRTKYF